MPAMRRSIPNCRQAVFDFRKWFGITEPIAVLSDNVGACGSKERDVPIDMTKYLVPTRSSLHRTTGDAAGCSRWLQLHRAAPLTPHSHSRRDRLQPTVTHRARAAHRASVDLKTPCHIETSIPRRQQNGSMCHADSESIAACKSESYFWTVILGADWQVMVLSDPRKEKSSTPLKKRFRLKMGAD